MILLYKQIFILFFSLALIMPCASQKTSKTETGAKLVQMADGTWKYVTDDGSKDQKEAAKAADQQNSADAKPMATFVERVPDTISFQTRKIRINYDAITLKKHLESEIVTNDTAQIIQRQKIDQLQETESENTSEDASALKNHLENLRTSKGELKLNLDRVNNILASLERIDKKNETSAYYDQLESVLSSLKPEDWKNDNSDIAMDSAAENKKYQQTYTFEVDDSEPYITPDNVECNFTFFGKDEESGSNVKELASQPFFSFTHERLKSFYKSEDYISSTASLTEYGAFYFIKLEMTINSKNANKTFGYVEKGSPLRILMINGDKIYPKNVRQAVGILEPYSGKTNYEITYLLDKSDLKQLKKFEIDKIGILWSTGFEEYVIYEVDLLKNMASCIEKKIPVQP